MSRRRRRKSSAKAAPDPRSVSRPVAVADGTVVPGGWLLFVVSILLLVRYFLPAESASLGETLWVVQLWLIAAVFWWWLLARVGESLRRWDRLDAAVGLLVGGHVLSAVVVLMSEGDRRASVNMLWEWIGVGVSTLLLRAVLQGRDARLRLTNVVVIAGISLSCLGLWQHHVWYPTISGTLAEYDQLQSSAPTDPAEAQHREERLSQLRQELGPFLSSGNDASTSQLLRARISASTEPIGRFALANTFAGLLVVALLLSAGLLLSERLRERTPGEVGWRWWCGAVAVVLVAYCFWLTKSRTALVGLLAGMCVWGMLSWRGRRWSSGMRWAALLVGVVLVALPVIASLSGGLDRQVITEAPKSLAYRLEYWTATGAIIRESPIVGVGPGNFRQAYLAHKLPGSSEEVLDPHNLFLDVWANGGLLALVGLLWLIVIVLSQIARLRPRENASSATEAAPGLEAVGRKAQRRRVVWRCGVGLVALGLASFVSLMSGSGFLEAIWWLAGAWCLASVIWPQGAWAARPVAVAAAAVALLVHLMGAGGIAMPAIVQTLVLLAGCLMPFPSGSEARSTDPQWSALPPPLPWQPMVAAAVCLCLSIACAFTATLPVSAARTQVAVGRTLMSTDRGLQEATRSFEAAVEADPLASEPWQELAIAYAASWRRLAGSDDADFDRAVQAQEEAIRLNPRAAGGWQMLGDLWWLRYANRGEARAAEEAATAYRRAVSVYPNQTSLQARLAEAALAAGDDEGAREAAQRAISLDEANRAAGHVDRYLPDKARAAVEGIVAGRPAGL